jgi:hypothetical protein
MIVAVLQRLLDTNTIQLDGVALWTSKVSVKALLLHNGSKFPSVSLAHAAEMKESYENLKVLLEKIQYEKCNWNFDGDINVIAVLFGLQLDYTKFCCLLSECVSKDRKRHYIQNSGLNENRLFQDTNVF